MTTPKIKITQSLSSYELSDNDKTIKVFWMGQDVYMLTLNNQLIAAYDNTDITESLSSPSQVAYAAANALFAQSPEEPYIIKSV